MQLTNLYFIVITCDHITAAGRRRTPRVARAASEKRGEWVFWSPGRRSAIREDSRIEMQRIDADTLRPTTGEGVMRFALECEYPGCRFRLVARNETLAAVLDELRTAGVRSITLRQLSANL